jgi:hypothetical protein
MREDMCIVHWLNDNSGAITAVATVALAILTFTLVKVGSRQAEVAEALRGIEAQRDREVPVAFVQVPNKNDGGVFEFKTRGCTSAKLGMEVSGIWVKPDGSVKVKLNDGTFNGYSRFILWREK